MRQPRLPGSALKLQEPQQNPAPKPSSQTQPQTQPSCAPEQLCASWLLLLHGIETIGGLCLSIIHIHSAEAPAPVELLGSHLCQCLSPTFPSVSSQGITLTEEIPRKCRLGLILLMFQMGKSRIWSHLPVVVVICPLQPRSHTITHSRRH